MGSEMCIRDRYTLRAPAAGQVLELAAHVGETAMPGVTLLSLGNLDTVDLVVYVPEPAMGTVHLGETTTLWADAFPQTPFRGEIAWICLLYTSDAADERSSVDLGGRRIIKKKTTNIFAG